jgi:hypothetical protein
VARQGGDQEDDGGDCGDERLVAPEGAANVPQGEVGQRSSLTHCSSLFRLELRDVRFGVGAAATAEISPLGSDDCCAEPLPPRVRVMDRLLVPFVAAAGVVDRLLVPFVAAAGVVDRLLVPFIAAAGVVDRRLVPLVDVALRLV